MNGLNTKNYQNKSLKSRIRTHKNVANHFKGVRHDIFRHFVDGLNHG